MSMERDSKIGNLLCSSAEIAELILCGMNSRQLSSCAKVCSLWSSIAKRLKRQRRMFLHTFQVLEDKSCGLRDSKTGSDVSEDTANLFLNRLRDSWSEPGNALVFATSRANRYINDTTGTFGTYLPYSPAVMDRISSCLPKSCLLLLGGARGVVGSPCEGPERDAYKYGDPVELEYAQAFSCLLLPAHPPDGVCIRPFLVTEDHVRKGKRGEDWYSSMAFKSLVGLPIDEEARNTKCILMFTIDELDNIKSDLSDMVNGFVDSCGACSFTLGGAVLNRLLAKGRSPIKGRVICTGFCFSGDAVRSASVLLVQGTCGAEAVERELSRLKRDSGFEGWKRGSTVAFMFASVKRGSRLHHRPNVEADAFARVFPGVPLVGLFDSWQIGNEYVPHLSGKQPGKGKRKAPVSYLHERATIIVLLSLGSSEFVGRCP
ncbi:F-box only protein 22 isoform X1 [Ixodes scapularis]